MPSKVDVLEKIGRFVLWIAIAIVFALVPIGMYGRDKQAAKDAEAASAERAREKAELAKERAASLEAKKPVRLTLSSMGPGMRALVGSEGMLWFTNASPREGVVCVYGVATNSTGQSLESLPSCRHVEAYESNIKISMMFAGGDLKVACPNGSCELSVKDVPASDAVTVAAAR